MTSEDISPCELVTATHVVHRNIIWRKFLGTAVKHFNCLVFLSFLDEVDSQLSEETTMGIAHAHHSLVEIDALLADATELEACHDVLVNALCVEVLHALNRFSADSCLERSDAVGKTFLHEVVAKTHVVVSAYGGSNINRTNPVTLHQHLKNHEVRL